MFHVRETSDVTAQARSTLVLLMRSPSDDVHIEPQRPSLTFPERTRRKMETVSSCRLPKQNSNVHTNVSCGMRAQQQYSAFRADHLTLRKNVPWRRGDFGCARADALK